MFMDYFYNNGPFHRDGFAGQRVKFFDPAQFLGFLLVEVAFDPLKEALLRALGHIRNVFCLFCHCFSKRIHHRAFTAETQRTQRKEKRYTEEIGNKHERDF